MRYTHAEAVERCREIHAQMRRIADDPTRQAEFDDLRDEFELVNRHRKRLEAKSGLLTGWRGYRDGSGGYSTLSGSTGTPTMYGEPTDPLADERDRQPHDPLVGLRDAAMRQLDSSVRSGLPARAAELCERLVGTGPEPERSWVARWVADTGSDAYRSAFAKLVALGEQRAGLEFTAAERDAFERVTRLKAEQRAMSLTDTAGGYLVPFELDPTIVLTSAGSINPLLSISRVIPTVSDVWHGVSSDGVVAEWLSEGSEAADGSPTLAEPAVPAHKMSVFVPFSVELQGDATSLMSELGTLLQDGASQLLNQALTTGTGTGEPTGFITALVAAGSPVVVDSDGSDVFAEADVYALQNALPPRYSANAQWCANLSTINAARQFESTNGARVFPELNGNPPMLLGRNINECSNMDGAVDAGAENYLLAYGDFTKFVVTQRVGSTIELIPHLVGVNRRPTGQRGVWLWARYGADVVAPAAFRLLNVT